MSPITLIALILLAIISRSSSYSTPQAPKSRQTPINRATFLSTTSAACLTFLSTPAHAKETDASTKGTKADPAFQACLSQCVYECTKPKGSEQRSRAECLPECKSKCATTKQQLLLGNPVSEK